ncbi:unnamed protein product [Merluccius merluccius]
MEKTVVSETEDQEKPMAAVEEPEQVAVNGHHEAERSPVNEKPTDDVPESAMPSEEKPPERKPEETLLMDTRAPDVSEKVEEPVGTEAPSAAVPDQPQPEGPPEKVSEAPEQETPPAVTEKAEEPVGAEERSEVVPAQPQPDEPTETVSPSGDITMGTESENLQLEPKAMKGVYEKVSIPLFYGWFLFQDKIKCTAMDFLKTLDSLDAFKKHLADFPVETEKEVDLEQYFHSSWSLHCTTKFCAYGKAQGAKEYAEKTAVQESYGSVWELSLTALFVTPRTVGARVSLNEAQLALWPADADKEAEAAVPGAGALPPGSRAHISLGCAEKVEPVQTGLDLLDILVLQQAGQQGELVEEMELGSLVYFDKGRWLLTLREPVSVKTCFSSVYKIQEADATKKEPEKKKKSKCSIL